jgi:glycerophosphoryl diester phosphodiesterase
MEIYNHNKIYQQNFFVFGHRGVPSMVQENTLDSFKKAIELGYDGIELDIMSTKDGHLIVNHDLALKFKKNSQEELVSEINYNQLKTKNIPLLSEILSSIGHQTKINIEIKDQGECSFLIIKKLIKELKEFNLIDNIIISSFNPFIIKKVKSTDDRFPTAWIWEEENFKFYNLYYVVLKYFKPNAIHIYHRIASQKIINKIHAKGLKVLAYTVNDKVKLEKLISKKIDGVFTDNPEILNLANQITH